MKDAIDSDALAKKLVLSRIAKISLPIIGAILLIFSILHVSSFLAILGISIIFWDTILIYITPTKHVPLTLLEASSTDSANIERVLSEFDLVEKGIYLPPKNLHSGESSLVFIPRKPKTTVPIPEESNIKLSSRKEDGILLTPPGLGLMQLFEKNSGVSFSKLDVEKLEPVLQKILIEGLEIMENLEIRLKSNLITIELTNSIFEGICRKTNSQPHTHSQVGCLLTSALACTLTKTVGKPITIQNENKNQQTKTVIVNFLVVNN